MIVRKVECICNSAKASSSDGGEVLCAYVTGLPPPCLRISRQRSLKPPGYGSSLACACACACQRRGKDKKEARSQGQNPSPPSLICVMLF